MSHQGKNKKSASRRPTRTRSAAKSTGTSESLGERYHAQLARYERLCQEVVFVLTKLVDDAAIKTHSLYGRVKELDSFLEKVERKAYSDPFQQIEDLVGARVVCLFLSDLAPVASLIRSSFKVISEDNRIEGQELDQFGYMSVHFVVKLDDRYAGPRYDGLHELPAEIQIRTILMDAWATVSHYLDYKGEASVPSELRRDFFALSGLFYVADRHFELFSAEATRSRDSAETAVEEGRESSLELNLDTMLAYLQKKLPNRRHSDPSGVSELVEELRQAGYETIDAVDRQLTRASRAFAEFEKQNPPSLERLEVESGVGSGHPKFSDVGVVRISLAIADPNYAQRKYRDSRSEEFEYLLEDES